MNNMPNTTEDIIKRCISGFHSYVLDSHPRLCYVSHNLCEMLECAPEELLHESRDPYALFVHPADSEKYSDFLRRLAKGERTLTTEYRLVKKTGAEIYVRDTVTTEKTEDGTLIGYSVLTDITDIKVESGDLSFLQESVPYGLLKYTCEKQPRITYINKTMAELLRFPESREGEVDYFEMYKGNIFLMVPMEERRRFSKYLNRVYSSDVPIAGEMTLLRCDGTRAYVFGWVTKRINEQGEEEFQSVCMDITKRHKERKANENKRYMKALSDVYDKIFEFDIDTNTVKCLHSGDGSFFKKFEGLAMQIDDALEKWIIEAVISDDRDRVRDFFKSFCQKKLYRSEDMPPQITYSARSSDGEVKQYSGVFIKVDESVSFYCCRLVRVDAGAAELKTENDRLRENIKEVVTRFTDGIAAFEITADGCAKPLYATQNICEFFGYTEEEWLYLTERFTPIETFAAYSETSYEDMMELIRSGEAEFNYFDYKTETEKRVKAICTPKEPDGSFSRYVILYAVDNGDEREKKSLPEKRTVSIRTFGYFDVFVGDKAIAFRNKKSKELFALLVDRRGGFVTSEEAIGFLWEDEPITPVTLARYRKVALRLKNTLEEYGISDVIESVDGKRRIVTERVQCDLYNYLSGKEEYSQLFKGSYLTNYSWAETTLGELMTDGEQ